MKALKLPSLTGGSDLLFVMPEGRDPEEVLALVNALIIRLNGEDARNPDGGCDNGTSVEENLRKMLADQGITELEVEETLPWDGDFSEREVWLASLKPGDQVWWRDPDADSSSGFWTIQSIDLGAIVDDGTVVWLTNTEGSVAQVSSGELISAEEVDPAVLDAALRAVLEVSYDLGSETLEGLQLAVHRRLEFAIGGGLLSDAMPDVNVCNWDLNLTQPAQDKLLLTLDVAYMSYEGEAADLASGLDAALRREIGKGLLTGHTDAEVDTYSLTVTPLTPAA